MILFCDTSALVKLYVQEEFSDEVRALADKARAIAVSRISRLLKNYCGGSSAVLRGVSSGRFASHRLRRCEPSPKLRLRSLADRFDLSRSLRSVRLTSGHPRYVFQQPATFFF